MALVEPMPLAALVMKAEAVVVRLMGQQSRAALVVSRPVAAALPVLARRQPAALAACLLAAVALLR